MNRTNGFPIAWAAVASCLLVCLAFGMGFAPAAGSTNDAVVSKEAPCVSEDVQDGGQAADRADSPAHPIWKNGASYRADEVLVELADGVTAEGISKALSRFDSVVSRPLSDADIALGWAKLELAPGTDVAKAIDRLESAGCIAHAQPNFVYHALEGIESFDRTPSTAATGAAGTTAVTGAAVATGAATATAGATAAPRASAKKADHAGQNALMSSSLEIEGDDVDAWYLDAVGAKTAWKTCKTNHAVTVAVIDSGCDVSHVALKANIVSPYNALNDSKNVSDANGHGTHVAGIVSAKPVSWIDAAGVSYNADIMPIKVMVDDETDSMTLVKAYRYVIRNAEKYNVRVINMSLGAEQNYVDIYDEALMRAIDQAYRANILSVFAGGNDGKSAPYYCFPCDFSEVGVGVINVGKNYDASANVANNGLPASSSNYNKHKEMTKDLSAPGVRILSTYPNDNYSEETGTSMAAPVVSGVAALVFTRNPSLSAGEAKSVLCSTAQDLIHKTSSGTRNKGFDDYTGYGLVRADLAVQGASSYLSGKDALRVGSTVQFKVVAASNQDGSTTWKWSSSNTAVATVDKTGLVKGVGHGEAAIRATNGSTTLYRTVVVYKTSFKAPSKVAIGKTDYVEVWSNPVSMWNYSSSNTKIASVESTSGLIEGKREGTVTITAKLSACPSVKVVKRVRIVKKKNPLKVEARVKNVSASQVKRKSRVVSCIVFEKKPIGKVTYAKVQRGSSKCLDVNKRTGKIIVAKGTKRGSYKIKVKVTAAGNARYRSVTKTVTAKVVVK